MVDDASEGPTSPTANGTASPRENGLDKLGPSSVPLSSQVKKEVPPPSPRSGTSSNASTPSAKKMEEREKPTTPISKPVTPTSAGMPSLFLYLSSSLRYIFEAKRENLYFLKIEKNIQSNRYKYP